MAGPPTNAGYHSQVSRRRTRCALRPRWRCRSVRDSDHPAGYPHRTVRDLRGSRTPSLTSRRRRKMAGVDDGARRAAERRARRGRGLEHDPEKWEPVFRKDHAQSKKHQSGMPTQLHNSYCAIASAGVSKSRRSSRRWLCSRYRGAQASAILGYVHSSLAVADNIHAWVGQEAAARAGAPISTRQSHRGRAARCATCCFSAGSSHGLRSRPLEMRSVL